MKKLLSALVLLLGAAAANAQVGIGTSSPNASAQLEIVSDDKGILIPRVSLTGTTDSTTITNGNIETLLVYNTAETSDVVPGYYYWYNNRWNRILTDQDLSVETVTTLVDNGDNTYTYTSENGTVTVISVPDDIITTLVYNENANTLTYTNEEGIATVISIQQLVRNVETVTSLVNNNNGTITYFPESGAGVTIDIAQIVADYQSVTSIIANVSNGTITFTDENGVATVINISDFVTQYETVTTLVNNGDGTYTYTNEGGATTTITNTTNANLAVTGSNLVLTDSEGNTVDVPLNTINTTNVSFTIVGGELVLTDSNGGTTTVDLTDINIVTTLVNNGDGTITFTDETGTATNLDLSTIIDGYETVTTLTADSAAGTLTYMDEDGNNTVVDIAAYIAAHETVTTLVNNGDGTYTYTNEGGATTTITNTTNANLAVTGSNLVLTDSEGNTVDVPLNTINTTNVSFTIVGGELVLTDSNGGTTTVDLTDINIVTTLVNNGDGTITFTDETGTATNLDLSTIIDGYETVTTLTADSAAGTLTYMDEDGNNTVVDIAAYIAAHETVTTLVNNGDGTYTYTNEGGATTTITNTTNANLAVTGSNLVLTDSEGNTVDVPLNTINTTNVSFTIVGGELVLTDSNGGTTTVDLTDINIVTTLVNNGDGTITFTDETGTATNLDLSTIIDGYETVTTLTADSAAGTLTYMDEDGNNTVVDIAAYIAAHETVTTLVNNNDGTYTYTNEAGATTTITNTTNANLAVTGGNLVLTDSEGNTTTISLSDINVVTTLVNNLDGTYTYKNEEGNDVTIDTNGLTITETSGVYTFTAADGSIIDTIDTNASALAYDNSTSGLTAGDVQAALDEVVTAIDDVNDAAATVNLVDNGDGKVTLVKADGTEVAVSKSDISANGDGTYTFTNNDGSDVTIDTNGLTITEAGGIFTFTAADGSIIDTIDTNASALAYDNSTSGLTAGDVQAALDEVVTAIDDVNDAAATVNLVDNGDGKVTLVKADGTEVAVSKSDISANGDGTYTFTNNDGSDVTIDTNGLTITETSGVYTFTAADGSIIDTIDTNASALAYDNSTSGLTAGDVQAALDEVVTAIDDVNDAAATVNLVDNGDGKVTLVKADGTEVAVSKSDISANGDGTYTFTNNDGSDVTIDTNGLTITEAGGIFTFTAADGSIIDTIDTNASALAYDNSTSGLTAGDVQAALDEVVTAIDDVNDAAATVNLVDNGDGKVTLVKADGTEVAVSKSDISANGDGTYTFTNNDGSDVTIDTNGLTITETSGVYTFTAADGSIIDTIDTNASALAYDNSTSGLTAGDVQAALDEVVTAIDDVNDAAATVNLVDNGDGKVTLVKADGTEVAVSKSDISANGDGTYTFTNNDGSDVTIDTNGLTITEAGGIFTFTAADGSIIDTIDTNASALAYDNSTSGLTAGDVQAALDEVVTAIDDVNDAAATVNLVDNGDGKVTLVKADGTEVAVSKSDISANGDGTYTFTNNDGSDVTIDTNGLTITETSGVYTFTAADGSIIDTIDTNASALAYDNSTSGLTAGDVQAALDEVVTAIDDVNDAAATVNLVDNGDGKVTLVKADGTEVAVSKSDISANGDGTYTFTNNDGSDVTIDTNGLTITEAGGIFTFTAADGSIIDTIDTNASALAYDNSTSGLTAGDVQAALDEVVTAIDDVNDAAATVNLVDNGDGKVTLVKADGTEVAVSKSDISANGDGTYTFTNNDGSDVTIDTNGLTITETSGVYTFTAADGSIIDTIDTNASALAYDNSTSGLTAGDVQAALDEVVTAIDDVNDAAATVNLVDNGDGKVTLVKADGTEVAVSKSDISANGDGTYTFTNNDGSDVTIDTNGLTITEAGGIFTFTAADGSIIDTIDTNASALAYDNSTSGLTAGDVQAALDEVVTAIDDVNDAAATVNLVDNGDGKVTLVKADGTEVAVSKSDISANGDGTYTFTNNDGSDVTIDTNGLTITEAGGIFTFTAADGSIIDTIDTNASALAYDNSTSGLTAGDVQAALDEVVTAIDDVNDAAATVNLVDNGDGKVTLVKADGTEVAVSKSDISANGDGTYTFTNNDGSDVTIDTNGLTITEAGGIFTFTAADGSIIDTIDTNASALAYDNSTSGLTAGDVQAALDEVVTAIDDVNDAAATVNLVDNGDGKVTLVKADGTEVAVSKSDISANGDGTYTFTNNDGSDVTIDTNGLTITETSGVYTFTAADGSIIDTIDTNASALAYDNSTSGLTAGDVQAALDEVVTAIDDVNDAAATVNLVDNGDGKVTLVKADGTEVAVSKSDISANGDGTYTFTNNDGSDVTIDTNGLTITEAGGIFTFTAADGSIIDTIDTNASALAYDNSTSGLTAGDVQAALDEVVTAIDDVNDAAATVNLVDNGDGKVTLVKADGTEVAVSKSDISANGDGTYTFTNNDGSDVTIDTNGLTITEAGGIFTFTAADGSIIDTIDTNASALAYDNSTSGLTAGDVQAALDEVVTAIDDVNDAAATVNLVDNGDGKVTLVKADGTEVAVSKSDISANGDGTYTFTNNDGSDVTIDTNGLTITETSGVYTFTAADGSIIDTIDTNASALAYDNSTSGLTAGDVQAALDEVVTAIDDVNDAAATVNLVDNGDGKVTLVKADGTEVAVSKSDISANGDGTYTFTNNDGSDVTIDTNGLTITETSGVYTFTAADGSIIDTIDTNASALAYDNSTSGLTAGDVQAALDEVVTAIDDVNDAAATVNLVDNGDGKVTLVKADGTEVAVSKSDISANGDGTYTFTNNDGSDVTIDTNGLTITEAGGIFTFTAADGSIIDTIDTNASALAYDNSTSGLTAGDVQAALDEVVTAIDDVNDAAATVNLVDNGDGKVTLVKADGTEVAVSKSDISANGDGTYTFTNNDGSDVTIDTNGLTITETSGVYTFTAADGSIIDTIDTNASALAYDNSTSGLTAGDVQAALDEVVTAIDDVNDAAATVNLVDNGDGKVTLVKADGTEVAVSKSDISANGDGTYTFTNNDGSDVTIDTNGLTITETSGVYTFTAADGSIIDTIDTNASALAYDNSTSGLTAGDVQAALDEVVTAIDDVNDAAATVNLVDNGDGKVTLVKADGTEVAVSKSDISANGDGTYTFTNNDGSDVTIDTNGLTITETSGVYTFTAADGSIIDTIDTNASALAYDNSTSGLTAGDVQAALDEVVTAIDDVNDAAATVNLVDNGDGKVTLVKADGTEVAVSKSDISANGDGTYTFTNNDGSDVTIDTNGLTITEAGGIFTFTAADGSIIDTIDTNASALAYDNSTSGLTAGDVQAALDEVVTAIDDVNDAAATVNLVDNGDGKVTLVKADGTEVAVSKSDISANGDGTYTFTNNDGSDVTIDTNGLTITETSGVYTFTAADGSIIDTIDTNASALAYDNSTSGLTAGDVQAALDEVVTAIDDVNDAAATVNLVDNGDGKVTLVKADGTEVAVSKSDISANGDGTYTFTNNDGSDVTIDTNGLTITEAGGIFTFTAADGSIIDTIDTNASALAYDNSTSGLTAGDVQAALDEVVTAIDDVNDAAATVNLVDNGDGKVTLVKADGTEVAVSKSDISANGDGTYTFTNNDGSDVTIDTNGLTITEAGGIFTFTAADGSIIDTIDTNASALAYDNSTSGLTAGDVQAALDEVVTAIDDVNDAAATVNLVDNGDGKVTLVKADGTEVAVSKSDISANGDGTYTFTNNDGSDVTIDTNGLTITETSGVYTFTAADGSIIDTIDTNASALAYDNSTSGLTAGDVQAALDEVVTAIDDVNDAAATVNLVDNGDGKVTLVKADGTEVAVSKSDISANGDGTYTFTNNDGSDVTIDTNGLTITETSGVFTFTAADGSIIDTIDTNASALAYDNSTSGLTAGDVQAALDEVVTAIDDVNDAAATVNLVDNGDGKVTLVKADGTEVAVSKSDISANGDGTYTFTNNDGSDVTIDTNGLTITEAGGIFTFTAADGSIIDTIDTNASALAYDNSTSGLTAGDVQAALDEVVTAIDDVNDAAATVNLVDNGDGKVTLVKADGTEVAVSKSDISANGDGTYTFTNNDGSDVTIDTNGLTITEAGGIFTFTAADGSIIDTIDTNASALAYDNSTSGLTAGDVQAALDEVVTAIDDVNDAAATVNLVDNGDGKVTLVKADGTEVAVSKSDISANGDGTYTFTNNDGSDVTIDTNGLTITEAGGIFTFTAADGSIIDTIDTNASALAYDNSTSGLTAGDVQAALDEVVTAIDDVNDAAATVNLVDNGDGKVTLVKADGTEVAVSKSDISANGDGTYTFTNNDGSDVTIDTNGLTITEAGGIFTFTAADGSIIDTIDTNASALAYDNSTSGLTAGDVQAALDEVVTAIDDVNDAAATVNLVDNGDGKVTLVKADGTEVAVSKSDISANGDGTYTFTNNDGSDVTIDTNGLTITEAGGIFTFTAADGSIIDTIDTNASALAYDNSTSGLTAGDVQAALDEVVTAIDDVNDAAATVNLVDNGDGKVTLVKADGTEVAVSKSDISANGDGTYTFTNNDGSDVTIDTNGLTITEAGGIFTFTAADGSIIDTIDTNASALAYDNSTSGLTAGDVQAALDEVVTAIDDVNDAAATVNLVDNGDGKVTLVKADGTEVAVSKSDISANGDGTYTFTNNDGSDVTIDTNGLTITETSGVYTFTAADGSIIDTIDTNASALAYDNSTSGLTAGDVQAALDEVVTAIDDVNDAAATVNLVDNGDGKVTLVKADGTEVAVSKSDISANGDGTYTFTNNDGSDVTIDTNGLTITEAGGIFTFTAADGSIIDTIDTNASALAYDNSTSGLTAGDVQAALDEVVSTVNNLADGNITSSDIHVDGGTGATFNDVSLRINDNVITTNMLVNDAVTNAKLADNAVATENIVNGTIISEDLANSSVTTAKLADDSVTAAKINGDIAGAGLIQNAITGALEVNVSALAGDGSITSTDLSVTGGNNATLNNVVLDINNGAVTTNKIANGAVTTAKMNAGTGANGRIAMADASGNVSFNAVSTYNISNGDSSISVSGGNNAALANTSISVNNGGITTAKLADNSVTTGKIADGTITEADIASGGNNKTLTTDSSGNVGWTDSPVIPNSLMPKFFYMPAVIFDTSVYTGTPVTDITRDLYQEYVNQFQGASNPMMVKSDLGGADEAPDDIPYLPSAGSMYYYITYYDTAVFANLSIDANGVLTYDVIGSGTQTSYMNIVFVIK